jgi:hypothetical protein
MNQQTPKWKDMPIQGKIEIAQLIAFFPALTLMAFTRHRIGFRMVKPHVLLCLALLLAIGPNLMATDHRAAPVIFAAAMLAMGIYHRLARWRGLCKGERWHTRATGISWLEWLPLPAFLGKERRIYRFLEPIGCFLVGLLVILLGLRSVGLCIIVASTALIIWEQGDYDRHLNRLLDLYDGLIDAEVQQQITAHYRQPAAQPLDMKLTAGLPTGLGKDIEANVEELKRRAENPDELTDGTIDKAV